MFTQSVKKVIFIIIGSIALFLGTIGIFLPLLPTVPFLLLASFFYMKSSEKLYNWLINHKVFGAHIQNYNEHRTIDKRVKIYGIVALWVSMSFSIFMVDILHVRIMLVVIAIAVSIHLFKLKSS